MTTSITSILEKLRLKRSSEKLGNATHTKIIRDLPEIPLSEVAMHDDFKNCWIVIYDRVYDVTNFLLEHPGGEDVIMDYAGRDATLAFNGTGHSSDAVDMLRDYLIGELPLKDRIFRIENAKFILKGKIPEC